MELRSFEVSTLIGRLKRSVAFIVLGALFVSLVPFSAIEAYTRADYSALVIAVHAPSIMNPGKQAEVEMVVKNNGKAPWYKTGANFVSLYSYDSAKKLEVSSPFGTKGWDAADRPAKLPVDRVNPGETISIRFPIVAPAKTGTYNLEFILVAENLVRFANGRAKFSVQVSGAPVATTTLPPTPSTSSPTPAPVVVPASPSNASYAGFLMLRSAQKMTVSGNGRQQFTFAFKNNGTATWSSRSIKVAGIQPALGERLGSVRDDSWLDASTPISMTGTTKPGELAFVTFSIQGPAKAGTYTANFQLYADDKSVDGATVEIPIDVTADGYIEPEKVPTPVPSTPSTPNMPNSGGFVLNPQPLNGDISALPNEPIIRVGLLNPEDYAMSIKASFVSLQVLNNGALVCTVPLNDSIDVSYSKVTSKYTLTGSACGTVSSSNWYVVRASDGISPMTLTDYARPVSWLPGANDNTFRAQLELRYAVKPDEIWVINELPVESYLKGIAETSNISPGQYQRALLTAARTYAMYHVNRGTKHASQNFTVDATYDQVYRGYGQEARSPSIVAAIDATRGQIVTYKGKLAITPFFSRSDGHTRNYEDVWGGSPIDWLKAVPAPGDEGKTLWGHGVGLSASSALYMDAKLGKNYDEILKQFYTGTELRKAYK